MKFIFPLLVLVSARSSTDTLQGGAQDFWELLSGILPDTDCQTPIINGNIDVIVDEKTLQLPIIESPSSMPFSNVFIDHDENTATLTHGTRAYIAEACDDRFRPEIFYQFKIMDKTMEYTVDLSNLGCGCNFGLYLVPMPAYNINQEPDPSSSDDYYCDANQANGIYCPEMDLLEGNNRNIRITAHACSTPTGKHYSHCDGEGYSVSAYLGSRFGPGLDYMIDSNRPFQVSHSFESIGGSLGKITTVISQLGHDQINNLTMTHDEPEYLQAMTQPILQGMVIAMSLWGTTGSAMSWLDVPACEVEIDCDISGTAVFSNIRVL